MEIGLLWYDGDPKRPLEDKVGQAAERYREKYGRWPNTCFVHPHLVGEQAAEGLSLACHARGRDTTIRLLPAANVLVHHFWVGETSDGGEDGQAGGR